jgi:hypothetical protein
MKKYIHILTLVFLSSCASNQHVKSMSFDECKQSKTCSVSGMVTITGDRGFIGELQIEKGKCVNISLPDEISKKLIDKEPLMMTVSGVVMPYPAYEEVSEFLVNGRKIGFGFCDDFYVFVKDGDFQFN